MRLELEFTEANTSDADGQITKQTLGNNVVTLRTYDTNGRLTHIQSGAGGGTGLQHLEYDWDNAGNLNYRKDIAGGLNETFGYDKLYRLRTTSTSYKVDGQSYASGETIAYDGHGNIRFRTPSGENATISEYKYEGRGPHAVSEKDGVTYTYDDNGNMLDGGGRTQDWTVFNKPSRIVKEGTTITTINLAYNAGRARMLKRNNNGETTWYFGSLYERTHKADGSEIHKYHLVAGKQVIGYIAQHKETTGAWVHTNTRYLLKDHIDSIDRVVDADGANDKGNLSFSAWGKRRSAGWGPITANVNFLSLLKDIEADAVKLGYTGHEMDDDVGLINMNGRLYDADLGRFISADPHIQAPGDTQSYNRYSYVMNNPLSYTDPTGYFSESFKKIMRSVVAIFLGAIFTMATSPKGGFAVYSVIIGGAVGGFVATGTAEGAWQGAFTALLFYGVGNYFGKPAFNTGRYYAKVAAHGVVGGVSSVLHGGKFKHGFFSAAFTQAVAPGIDDHIDTGNKGISLQRTMAAAVVGGTASKISGGKFANGATTAAFSYLFSNAAASQGPRGRALTADEITEAQKAFGDKIDYSQVRIIDGKFVPWQGKGYVMAPDGNIYWPGECGNLAVCNGGASAGTFIHEMTHVLQAQHDVSVLGRGLLLQAGKFLSFGLYDPYSFTYDTNRAFSSYNIEQQGDIARGIYYGRYPNNIDY